MSPSMGMRNIRARTKEPVSLREIDRRTLGRAWVVARAHRGSLFLYLITILLAALLGALPPLLFKDLINRAIPERSVHLLIVYAVELALLTFGQSAVGILNRYLASVIGEGIIYRLRVRLFNHLQKMSLSFFTHSQTGAILSRINSDVLGSQQVVGTLGSVVSDISTLVFTLIFMFELSPTVTGLALLVVPVILILDRLLGSRLAKYARIQMQANAAMSSFEQERFNVSGSLVVALFGNHRRETDQFQSQAAKVRDAGIRFSLYGRLYFTVLSLMGGIGTVAVYAIGGREAIAQTLTIGALVALAQYITQIFGPLTDLASARVNLLQALVSFDRVFEVLDLEPAVITPAHPIELANPVGRIVLDRVRFSYPQGVPLASLAKEGALIAPLTSTRSWAIDKVSLTIEAGTTVALVGPSGAGKTTITQLLTRLYDPQEGSITIDGINLRDLDLDALRSMIGVVTQDPFLFHDTVYANLAYANPDTTKEAIEYAVEASQLAETIEQLPNGLDSIVGERGYRLSGGEKQRLAIARVLIKDPKIVILDEATSSLDSTNEGLVQQAIAIALAGRTSVVIAHRLSTVLGADTICVLDHGKIVEVGPHSELVTHDGIYSEFFRRQFSAIDEDIDPINTAE
ncbi:MAG: ABC transporter ATP-binding protein [Ferrimicrobium sp.]